MVVLIVLPWPHGQGKVSHFVQFKSPPVNRGAQKRIDISYVCSMEQIERERMCILLADDNPEVRSALRLLLEQEPVSASILEVSDSQSLLACLRESCPVAVLLDWELPGPKKSDLLNTLNSCCPEMKVIALSSKYEARREALAAGVDAFVSKAEPSELVITSLDTLVPGLIKR